MSLKKMILKSNDIKADGGAAIGRALANNESLTFIDISCNEIGDDGGLQFANMLQVHIR
jgi:hypothetical protein